MHLAVAAVLGHVQASVERNGCNKIYPLILCCSLLHRTNPALFVPTLPVSKTLAAA